MSKLLPYVALITLGLALVGVFLLQEWRMTGALSGAALDDSWIHYRFADNLHSGRGFAFNPGEATPGSTSPLWVGLLSLLDNGYLIPSKVVGILAYLACGMLVYRLGQSTGLSRSYAFLSGAATLAAGRMVWAAPSGMETTTFALASLAALWLWSRQKEESISSATSLVFGLACLLRPEGYLVLTLSGIAWLVNGSQTLGQVNRLLMIARHFLIAGVVILPYLAFSFVSTGQLLPNTFYAKSTTWGCRPGIGYFLFSGLFFLFDNPLVVPLAAYGLVIAFRSGLWKNPGWVTLGGMWIVGLPLVYGLLAPCLSAYYSRYTSPLIPLVMLFGGLGGQQLEIPLARWIAKTRKLAPGFAIRSRLGQVLMAEGCALALLPTLFFWGPFFGQSTADIQNMQVNIGRWLARNSSPGDVLALNDIGAIGFIADRQVVDLGGLVSPEVLPLIRGKGPGEWDQPLAKYLAARRPDYLVVFPDWYPQMVRELPLEPVYRVQLSPRTIAGIANITVVGGGEMVVYKINW